MDKIDEKKKKEVGIDHFELTVEEKQFVSALQAEIHFSKGSIILCEGQITTKSYYVVKGCVRKYHLKDGEEKTTEFFIEDDPISTKPTGVKQVKSTYNLECVEDTVLTMVTSEQEELIYTKFPRFQSVCRISSEQQLIDYQERFAKFIASSPKERYLNLLDTRPELINRVPQYQLASYLGVKPESLSRIRKRLMDE